MVRRNGTAQCLHKTNRRIEMKCIWLTWLNLNWQEPHLVHSQTVSAVAVVGSFTSSTHGHTRDYEWLMQSKHTHEQHTLVSFAIGQWWLLFKFVQALNCIWIWTMQQQKYSTVCMPASASLPISTICILWRLYLCAQKCFLCFLDQMSSADICHVRNMKIIRLIGLNTTQSQCSRKSVVAESTEYNAVASESRVPRDKMEMASNTNLRYAEQRKIYSVNDRRRRPFIDCDSQFDRVGRPCDVRRSRGRAHLFS